MLPDDPTTSDLAKYLLWMNNELVRLAKQSEENEDAIASVEKRLHSIEIYGNNAIKSVEKQGERIGSLENFTTITNTRLQLLWWGLAAVGGMAITGIVDLIK